MVGGRCGTPLRAAEKAQACRITSTNRTGKLSQSRNRTVASSASDVGDTPDNQSAPVDQSPAVPVIQFCVVITRRSSVTSAIAEYLYDGHGLWCCALEGAAFPKRSSISERGLISFLEPADDTALQNSQRRERRLQYVPYLWAALAHSP